MAIPNETQGATPTISSVLLALGLLWFGILPIGLAGSWDALDQLGYNPTTGRVEREAADERIRAGIAFGEARLTRLEPSEEVSSLLDEALACVSSLDLAELYSILPYVQEQGDWRGLGVRGAWNGDTYSLALDDPGVSDWVGAYERGEMAAWGRQERFGDLGELLFLRPVTRKQLHLFFQYQFYTHGFPAGNLARTARAFLASASDLLATSRPRPSKRTDLDHLLARWLAADFPHLHATFTRYVRCEQIIESVEPDGTVRFRLRVTANEKAFRGDYPALARLVHRGRKITSARSRIVDERGNTLLETSEHWDSSFIEIRFRSRDGIILPLGPDATAEGFDPVDPSPREFQVVSDFQIRSLGARLTVSGISTRLRYHFADAGPGLAVRLTDAPEEIRTGGWVLGIIPVWLIDLVVPSNLEDMTAEFIGILAEGRDGEGMSLRIGRVGDEGLQRNLWIVADTDIASNGFMKFGFDLFRRLAGGERSVSRELRAWAAELLDAFKKDEVQRRTQTVSK